VLQALAVDGAPLAAQLQALARAAHARQGKLPAKGTVLETARPFVPHDARMAKLLGTA
jgi:hypothetical protein